jgi:subtilase family serine protease
MAAAYTIALSMRGFALICAALLAGCLSAGAVGADAVAGGGAVRVGAPPPVPRGARVEGAAPESKDLRLVVALQPRDPGALERFATEASTPGSAGFRDYVSVPEFARRFGATPAQIATVRSALGERGLDVGAPGRNGLSLPVTATVGEAESAFGISVERVRMPSGRTAYANDRAPAIPAAAAPFVQAVVGLDDVAQPHRQAGGAGSPLAAADTTAGPAVPAVVTGGPQPCEDALDRQKKDGGYTADQIASAYQLSDFYGAGNFGAGQTIALLELEPFSPADIATYQACYGTNVPVSEVNINGGPGPYAGEDGESALDIEQLIGLAPGANIVVYQAPNIGNGEIEILSAYVEQNVAKVMSSSWGICEKEVDKDQFAAVDTLLQEAAAQGQSFFVAAGDDGSTDCYEPEGPDKDKSLAVDFPGSDPFATDVGGTQMEAPTVPPTEYLWNDEVEGGAGGSGVSAHFPMPAYQREAAPGLGVIGSLSSGATCGFAGYCRQIPDVSANASPDTGYVVHAEGKWQVIGGTSAAAPLWTAFAALTNASPACHGFKIGFANPSLYTIAGSSAYAAAFHDITGARPGGPPTTNMFESSKPYPAAPGYDMATGIGTPVGPALGASLCGIASAGTVPVANPGAQRAVVANPRLLDAALSGVARGRPKLTFSLAARTAASLRWVAVKLPVGLALAGSQRQLTKGVAVFGTGQERVSAKLQAQGRTLTIHLPQPRSMARFRVATPALSASPELRGLARRQPSHPLRVVLSVGETGSLGARYPLSLNP